MYDKSILRDYAKQWMDCALDPVMAERRRGWAALNSLNAERPMVLVETCLSTDYVTQKELKCSDDYLRGVEKLMLETVRHAREIGDDVVVEPYFRLPYDVDLSDFGVEIEPVSAVDSFGDSVACVFRHPVKILPDIQKLKPRRHSVDIAESKRKQNLLGDIFGDILPVSLGGFDPVYGAGGYSPFAGLMITEITLNLYKLLGMDNIYFWLYDEPDLMHRLMQLLTDDFIAYSRFLEDSKYLSDNSDSVLTGGRYGYLPGQSGGFAPGACLSDMWLWCTVEEMTTISPKMFKEFILPYLKKAAALYGRVYYGCCEKLECIWSDIVREIPNIAAASVSPFCNEEKMAEMLGRDYVFSRKPLPSPLALKEPDYEMAEKSARKTWNAAKGCNLEFILRDVYRLYGDRGRFKRWVDIVRSTCGF